jgi:DNA-binding PadR family transcriptional regulator
MSLHYAILGLLTYEPRTGYDLKAFFDNSINFMWTASLSQIYRELAKLEGQGYVTSVVEPQTGRPDKKIYLVTEEGEQGFRNWLVKFPGSLSTAVRDEFSVRLFFGSRLTTEETIFQLRRFIKEKQEEMTSLHYVAKVIEHYSRQISAPEEEFYWKLIHKRGLMTCTNLIEWAEESIREIENHPTR